MTDMLTLTWAWLLLLVLVAAGYVMLLLAIDIQLTLLAERRRNRNLHRAHLAQVDRETQASIRRIGAAFVVAQQLMRSEAIEQSVRRRE